MRGDFENIGKGIVAFFASDQFNRALGVLRQRAENRIECRLGTHRFSPVYFCVEWLNVKPRPRVLTRPL
ncbi:hypothetical protein D3C87_1898930 [compost metagenome]